MGESLSKPIHYEDALSGDYEFSCREGDLYFRGESLVWEAARRIINAHRDRDFPAILVGDLAMFLHGYRRFTQTVEILVVREAVDFIRQNAAAFGVYLPFTTANWVRDLASGVKIKLHIAGAPRTPQPPHVFLPNPADCSLQADGFPFIELVPLIDMRLAVCLQRKGGPLGEEIDVIELIRVLHLKRGLVDQLHPLVQSKYLEYWTCLNDPPPKYIRPLRAPGCLESMDDPDELLAKCGFESELRAAMMRDGILLERRPSGRAMLTTTDYDLAEKYDMHLEEEYWRIDEY